MDALLIMIPILLPAAGGFALLVRSFRGHEDDPEKLHVYTIAVLACSVAAALFSAWTGERSVTLFTLAEGIPVYFHIDAIGRWFVTVVSLVWMAAGIFALGYMGHEGKEGRYFGFYLMLYGALTALDFSGNLVTMYLFYELITLLSMPLVLHSGTKESIMAALKYLFYSMCGAYGGLFGIFFLNKYCVSLDFAPGGTLDMAAAEGHEGILLAAVFVMLAGFGAKAGMLPLHGWLPTAHPAASSPASAVLSGIIVKAGVLAAIRTVYYITGAEFLRGTWVQYLWMILALATIVMGSLLACRQRILKKRLAYSTVSQVSYILLGLSLLQPLALEGALFHVAAHAFAKCGLFLTAGAFLYQRGITRVDELAGLGRKMPGTLWCYLLFSLGLIGIPPTGGFISKWYLAEGALQSGMGFFAWLAPVVLLASALLTAGYLLPIALRGFFPGAEAGSGPDLTGAEEKADGQPGEARTLMLAPLIVLAAISLLLGLLPGPALEYAGEIARSVLW